MPEPLFHEVYDTLFAGKGYREEMSTALRLGGMAAPGRVLELGSGTGNHTMACAELGYTVTGVEVDGQMLAVARRKLELAPRSIRQRVAYFHGQVGELREDGFGLALALFNVVNYILSAAALQACMTHVAQRLKPGASFVFDAWNGTAALRDPPRPKVTTVGGVTATLSVDTDRTNRVAVLTYRIETANGRSGEHCIRHALWQPREVRDAAQAGGLEIVAVTPLGDTSRAATDEDWKILFQARRPRGHRRKETHERRADVA